MIVISVNVWIILRIDMYSIFCSHLPVSLKAFNHYSETESLNCSIRIIHNVAPFLLLLYFRLSVVAEYF